MARKTIALVLLLVLALCGCAKQNPQAPSSASQSSAAVTQTSDATSSVAETKEADASSSVAETKEADASSSVVPGEDTACTSKEDVALYLHTYGHLPPNFITKKDAQAKGWDSSKGNLQKVLPGMSIGGDRFGNREGLLPDKKGRQYYECDIDYDGGSRNAKRIVYSNDGLIFYTEDHYASFEQLY